jgi:hypothetical protein
MTLYARLHRLAESISSVLKFGLSVLRPIWRNVEEEISVDVVIKRLNGTPVGYSMVTHSALGSNGC